MSSARKARNLLSLILFGALSVVAMEWLATNIGQQTFQFGGYRVDAVFQDAAGIPKAADVRVAGVLVGKVTDVKRRDATSTVVTLDITEAAATPVCSDGVAKIRPKTLLGEKYVDLTLGCGTGASRLQSGALLGVTRTAKTVDNDEIFNAFDARTRAQQQQVIAALDQALAGRSGDIQAILPQLGDVIANLQPVARVYEADNPVVDQIFTSLDQVVRTLADEHVQLGRLLDSGGTALGAIASRDRALVTTLKEATNVQNELDSVLTSTVVQQQQAIDRGAPALGAQHAFVDQIVGPHCPNNAAVRQLEAGGVIQPGQCGLLSLLVGTLLGQVHYPNDQLTVSTPSGMLGTQYWDSMFSTPASQFQTGDPTTHSALSIVLSEHCDALGDMGANAVTPQADQLLHGLLGIDPGSTLGKALLQGCNALNGRTAAYSGPGASPGATVAAELPGGMGG